MSNNFTGTFNTHGLRFSANNNSVRTIGGNLVRLFDFNFGAIDPFIENNSSATHVMNFNLEGDGDGADPLNFRINSDGGLTFGGTINNQGTNINIVGSTSNATSVTFNGDISGSGGFYKENSNITAVITSNSTYSGQTTVQGGTLRLSGSGSLPSSNIRLHSSGTLNIANSATVLSVGEFASNNSGVISINSGAVLTITGGWSGTLFQNSISGSGGLTKQGDGTLSLFGTQNYSGSTTVSGGSLTTSVQLTGTTNLTVNGGTFIGQSSENNTLPTTANVNLSSGTIEFRSNQTLQNLTATGGTIIIAENKTLTITGKLSVAPGVIVTLQGTTNPGKIVYQNGADLEFTSSVTTTDAIWPSTGGPTDVIINAPGNEVTLHASRTITGNLTFTNGKLLLGNHMLTVIGTISGPDENNYVKTNGTGKLVRNAPSSTPTTFPVGESYYNPVTITNPSGMNWSVNVRDGLTVEAPFSDAAAVKVTWDITPSTNPTVSGSDITFQYNRSTQVGGSYVNGTNMQAFRRNRYDEYWLPAGNTGSNGGTVSGTTVTITNLTQFSKYALSNSGSPLPVTFTSLTGSIRNGKANLSWNIADEHNVDRYEVEESANGRQFQAFTQVDAASRSSYQAIDAQLHTGANYYRVKAVDIDGKLTYSKIIRLDNNSAVDNDIRVYPNPSRGELNLGLNIPAGNYQIRLINAVGQTVYQQPLTHEGGSRSMQLGLPKLSSGVYQVEVRGGVQKHVRTVRIE